MVTALPDKDLFRAGGGNWEAFTLSLELVHAAADEWKQKLNGVERPWLCWNVNTDWCLVQQKLVRAVGWTPVVGFDPRAGAPDLISGSVLIDFNRHFGFPLMKFFFPLEFSFLFADRLAFWHSDLLCRLDKLLTLSDLFRGLESGEIAAVIDRGGLRNIGNIRKHRFWELIGCTTREASRDQFEHGCGWWKQFYAHPSCPDSLERERRKKYYWDSGVGIMYWTRKYGGRAKSISAKYVEEGHCSRINNPRYVMASPNNERRDITRDLQLNYDLREVCKKLGIEEFLF